MILRSSVAQFAVNAIVDLTGLTVFEDIANSYMYWLLTRCTCTCRVQKLVSTILHEALNGI